MTGWRGLLLLAGAAVPAAALADTRFGATVEGTAGYDSNPYLGDDAEGSFNIGATFLPYVDFVSPTSSTRIGGRVQRVEYLEDYDASEYYGVDLGHTQQFSERLSGSVSANFADATTALLTPEDANGIFASSQRTRSFGGNANLNFVQDSRNQWGLGANIQRSTYPGEGNNLGDYTSFGGNASYTRVLSERTSIGASVGVNRTNSSIYPDSEVVQPRLTLTYKINEHWTFDGGAGVIFQKSKFGPLTNKSTNFGFDASLCGKYPRANICVTGSRDTSASGFGGLRTRTAVGSSLSYDLAERTRLSASANWVKDESESFGVFNTPNLTYADVTVRIDRDLTQRISAGVNGNVRSRKYETFGSNSGWGLGLVVSAKLGRLQ